MWVTRKGYIPFALAVLITFSTGVLSEGVYIKETSLQMSPLAIDSPDTKARLVLRFEGGEVSQNLARAIEVFGETIPSKRVRVERGDNLCAILDRSYPDESFVCSEPVALALAGWNEGIDLANLRVGDIIVVPDIEVSSYDFNRLYYNDVPEQRRELENIRDSWQAIYREQQLLKGGEKVVATRLVFTGYEITIPIERDEKTLEAVQAFSEQGGRNAYGYIVGVKDERARPRHSRPSELAINCVEGSAGDEPSFLMESVNGVATNLMSMASCKSECQWNTDTDQLPTGCSEIWLVDETPLSLHADFEFTVAAEGSELENKVCPNTPFDERTHHATHLASIMVSRANNIGYVGVSPQSVLEYPQPVDIFPVWNWWTSVIDELSSDGNPKDAPVPRVLVFTSETRDISASSLDDNGKLIHERMRLSHGFAREITNSFDLMVAAVGQPDGDVETGEQIDLRTPLLPQTLGNKKNVLIVTACQNCSSEDATIWRKANYSYPQVVDEDPTHPVHLVGVAAPGGDPLPALVSDGQVASAPGTSQAAAYVGGLAGAMLNCYPDGFNQPMELKERILQTARPPRDAEDRKRVATGIVDAQAAMLDPKQHWLKRAVADQYEAVDITEWCIPTDLQLKDPASRQELLAFAIAPGRVVRWLRARSAVHDGFDYYAFQEPRFNGEEIPDSALKRTGPGFYEGNHPLLRIALDDESSEVLRVSDVADLILSHPVRQASNVCSPDTI